MITDCLARDRRLAIVGLKPGYEAELRGPAARARGRAAWARSCSASAWPTGRFNLLLQGEGRVRIERELPSDTLYRMVAGDAARREGGDRRGVSALSADG